MSSILRQIYLDLTSKSRYREQSEDIEMIEYFNNNNLQAIPWPNLKPEEKKKYILCYMKCNNIEGDISQYTFKNISFNKEKKQIIKLNYYRKK